MFCFSIYNPSSLCLNYISKVYFQTSEKCIKINKLTMVMNFLCDSFFACLLNAV